MLLPCVSFLGFSVPEKARHLRLAPRPFTLLPELPVLAYPLSKVPLLILSCPPHDFLLVSLTSPGPVTSSSLVLALWCGGRAENKGFRIRLLLRESWPPFVTLVW